MELPDFGPPKVSQPQSTPQSPSAPAPDGKPRTPFRHKLQFALVSLGMLTIAAVFAYQRILNPPENPDLAKWAKSQDPEATAGAKALVDQRDRERLTAELVESRALLARARALHGDTKDIRSLNKALDSTAVLLDSGQYEAAALQIERVRKNMPLIKGDTPLAAPPKLVDVKAPVSLPGEKPAVKPASETASPAPAKKAVKKKTSKKRKPR